MYLFLGMVAFFLITLPIVYRLEKRTVWLYGELQPRPCFEDSSGYAARTLADAGKAGFSTLGWAPDRRGGTYRLMYALMVAADRSTFAVICVGTMAKIPFQGTWLHTPTADGRCFYSTDTQSGVQMDLSGNWTNQLVPKASFQNLWQRHQEWIREMRVLPRPFTSGQEMKELRAMREQHFRSMERAGLISYTDVSASQFYFTTVGAIKTAHWSYLLGLIRAVTGGRIPRSA